MSRLLAQLNQKAMSATVEICESNGAGQIVTHNILNSNMGNNDSANLDAQNYPVSPGNLTYEKWQRFHVTNMSTSSKVFNLKVWRTGNLGGAANHSTNASQSEYAGAAFYTQPVSTLSAVAFRPMPTAEPGIANIGISGSLLGFFTAVGYSDYFVHQIGTNISDISGSTSQLHFMYDEVA